MSGSGLSPLSLPVLGGAAIVSSPALWRALVEGTTTVQLAMSRYLVSVVICWLALAFVVMLVGPAPRPEPAAVEDQPEGEPGTASAAR